MLSIDEVIEDLKYDIEIDMYIHDIAPQIAEWLEELKDYQDKNKMVVRVDVENMDSIKDKIEELSRYAESQYNKDIDDFAKWLVEHKIIDEDSIPEIIIDFNEEQLKAGGENGKLSVW